MSSRKAASSLNLVRIAHITLLELMIVIALLSLTAGVIGLNVRGFLHQQNVLDEMGQVVGLFKKAQEMMVLLNQDSMVRFHSEPEGITVEIIPLSTPSKAAIALIPKEKLLLKYIKTADFEDAYTAKVWRNNLDIFFTSKGFLMNRGLLKMEGDGTSRTLVLLGYPAPIHLQAGDAPYPHDRDLQEFIQKLVDQTASETKTS